MTRPGRPKTGFRARRPGGKAGRRRTDPCLSAPGDPVALFSDLLRAWHGDLPWRQLARRAERGLAALLDAAGSSPDDGGDAEESRYPSPPFGPDEVSLQGVAEAEARLVKRQAAFRSAADAMESLRGQALAQWPGLLAHPGQEEAHRRRPDHEGRHEPAEMHVGRAG